jgi:hypothetical protein
LFVSADMYEVKLKSKGAFKKKYIYCKYTDTKVILLFNVIPLDFNAPVSLFHIFFNFVKNVFLDESYNQFCTAPMTSSSDESLLPLRASFIGPNIWKPQQCRPDNWMKAQGTERS